MTILTEQWSTDKIADLFGRLVFEARRGDGAAHPTSGSYLLIPEEYGVTVGELVSGGLSSSLRGLAVPEFEFGFTVYVSTYIRLVVERTSANASDEMARLEAAAEARDEQTFLPVLGMIDWRVRPPEDFLRAVQLALAAGAHLAARRLSAQGAGQYPDHSELQRYARVLAPPKVTQSNLPSDPTLKPNRDWLMMQGDQYRGQWVALRDGALLASALSLKRLAQQLGDTKGILLTKVF